MRYRKTRIFFYVSTQFTSQLFGRLQHTDVLSFLLQIFNSHSYSHTQSTIICKIKNCTSNFFAWNFFFTSYFRFASAYILMETWKFEMSMTTSNAENGDDKSSNGIVAHSWIKWMKKTIERLKRKKNINEINIFLPLSFVCVLECVYYC